MVRFAKNANFRMLKLYISFSDLTLFAQKEFGVQSTGVGRAYMWSWYPSERFRFKTFKTMSWHLGRGP